MAIAPVSLESREYIHATAALSRPKILARGSGLAKSGK
jgi:hypothetical protein